MTKMTRLTQLGHGLDWLAKRINLESSGDRPYSTLMPAKLITLAHFLMASEMIVPNAAGVPPSTVPPSSTIRPLILLSARPALSSLFSNSTISPRHHTHPTPRFGPGVG